MRHPGPFNGNHLKPSVVVPHGSAALLSGGDGAQPFEEGTRLLQQGRFSEAVSVLCAAVLCQPDRPEGHANLALALDLSRLDEEAESHYRRALALAPQLAQIWINLGALLERRKRYAEAEQTYCEALRIEPDSAAAWTSLGVLHEQQRRHLDAEQAHRRALALAPGWPHASVNLAMLLLRLGRLEEGWPYLEARDWYAQVQARIGLARWRGEPLRGRAVLLGVEAGHGDMIQFCRYAPWLKRLGASRVGVLCHPGLQPLFEHADGIDQAIAVGVPAVEQGADQPWDLWCPMLSLPGLCGTRLDTIPDRLPYLKADPARLARWLPRLREPRASEPSHLLRVGLVWKGNPGFVNDHERSLASLHALAPLGRVARVRFVSLQKGEGEAEALPGRAPFPITPLGAEIGDFADTAAVLSQLDLLIAVDTAAAHLAGALACPCWVLLPHHKTDWRWLDDRTDSPWYPGVMRLYRQQAGEDWARVILEVARDLACLVEARGSSAIC